ncbi:MAG: WG repeat-containing protein [Acidobacteria bacterium]|nr:WG repeat-containing protein [Acidobacteriota bacterium]
MLRTVSIVVLIAFVSLVGLSQDESSKKLFSFKLSNKCGYIDQEGKIVISPQFDFCDMFSEGLAAVSLSGKSGYIDETGKIVIPPQFDYFLSDQFSEGLASITLPINGTRKRERGYVDRFGQVKLLEGVLEVYPFSEGIALFKQNERYGYINKRMEVIIQPEFFVARSFSNGRAWVSDKSGNEYYIDVAGRKVIADVGTYLSDFSEGLATVVTKYYGYAYIDVNGKQPIKRHFLYACLFNEGLACAKGFNGKWGYIDKMGAFVISPRFDEAGDFSSDGIAVASLDGKYGLIDRTGKFVIQPRYDDASWLGGLALVEASGVRQYINHEGEVVFQVREPQ